MLTRLTRLLSNGCLFHIKGQDGEFAVTDCIFCKIVEGEIPSRTFLETPDLIAFLDINPATLGHSLVVPKEHVGTILDANAELIGIIFSGVKEVGAMLKEKLNCDGFNVLANQGRVAGQVIDHLHVHVIPRYTEDGIHFLPPERKIDEKEMDKILTKLKG